jgi:1-acyl-sn-glycerol-3-phosphate acyltransferase
VIVVRVLHSFLAVIVIVVSLIPLAILAGLLGMRASAERVVRLWCRTVLAATGARVVSRQLGPIDPTRSYVFVSNHTSHMDVPAIVSVAPVPPRFIAKRELSRIPIFGWAADRVGHVFVDRRDSHGASRAIERRLSRGLSGIGLFFFAEGTRSTTGELLPFKKGAAIVALQAGLDCIPIGVAGARDVLPPKGPLLFRPGTIAVVFGEPIRSADYTLDRRDELVAAQRAAVERAVAAARELLTARAGSGT